MDRVLHHAHERLVAQQRFSTCVGGELEHVAVEASVVVQAVGAIVVLRRGAHVAPRHFPRMAHAGREVDDDALEVLISRHDEEPHELEILEVLVGSLVDALAAPDDAPPLHESPAGPQVEGVAQRDRDSRLLHVERLSAHDHRVGAARVLREVVHHLAG